MLPGSIRCVVVGDVGIGKSALIRRYISDEFKGDYEPTVQDEYSVRRLLSNGVGINKIQFEISDTGGHGDLDRLRPLVFGKSDVIVVCFSVVIPASFKNVAAKWLPEIRRHTARHDVPVILVGTQVDLRSNFYVLNKLSNAGLTPVFESKALKLAKKIGAKSYVECSSYTRKNVRQVFDSSIMWGLQNIDGRFAGTHVVHMTGDYEKYQQTYFKCNKDIIGGGAGIWSSVKGTTGMKPYFCRPRRLEKPSKLKRLLLLSCFPRF